MSQTTAVDSTSDDSASTDEENETQPLQEQMTSVIKVKEGRFRMYELDSRVGLQGCKSLVSFDCLMETESKRFFVWLGDITIDKFTKSTFLNIVSFAEKAGASSMVVVQNRDHAQKDQYRKLFSVLDAKRVGKSGMKEMLTAPRMSEWVENYALYELELQ